MRPKSHSSAAHIFIALVGILLFSYFSRLLHLGDQSLWVDEAFTYMVTKSDTWLATLSRDVHPPLYFALITLWTNIVGISEFSFRYPSVLASVVSTALMVVLAKEIPHHRPRRQAAYLPLIAALLFALADLEIQVSQEARSYTLHLVWVLLHILAYLKWLRTTERKWAVLFVISAALIVYTHYIGVFTSIALGGHALFFLRGKQRVQAIALLVLAAGLFAPWLFGVVIPQQIGKFASDVVPASPSNLETLWRFRLTWFTQQWALLIGLALLGLVAVRYAGQGWQLAVRPLRGTIILLLWILVPLGLAFWSNLYLPTLYDYRISQITPAVVLLIALGLANLRGGARSFLLLVIVVHSVVTVEVYRPKPPWQAYGAMVAEAAKPGDLVVMDFTGVDYALEYYLDQLLPPDVEVVSMWQWRTFQPETYESGLLGTMYSYDTIWLARWSSTDEAFIKLNATQHQRTDRSVILHVGNELELYRFDRTTAAPLATFENGMILQDATIHGGQTARVDLIWRTENVLDADYVVSVKAFNTVGALIAQSDAPLQPLTSTWDVTTLDYDAHYLTFSGTPSPDAGTLDVTVQLYRFEGDKIVTVLSRSSIELIKVGQLTP